MEKLTHLQIEGARQRAIAMDITFEQGDTPKPLIVFIHGFKGFKDWGHFNLVAEALVRKGFTVLKFNFSHNGTTPAQPTEFVDLEAFGNNNLSLELDDLGKVIDYTRSGDFPLSSEVCDVQQLYLIGHSRGGGIAILKAAEDQRVKKLATWAAVNDFSRNWDEATLAKWREDGVVYVPNSRTGQQMPLYWQLYEDYRKNYHRLHIPEVIKKLNIPYLIVHGTADATVPYQSALDLKKWYPPAKLLTVPDGDHTFGGKHPWPLPELPPHTGLVVDETAAFFKAEV